MTSKSYRMEALLQMKSETEGKIASLRERAATAPSDEVVRIEVELSATEGMLKTIEEMIEPPALRTLLRFEDSKLEGTPSLHGRPLLAREWAGGILEDPDSGEWRLATGHDTHELIRRHRPVCPPGGFLGLPGKCLLLDCLGRWDEEAVSAYTAETRTVNVHLEDGEIEVSPERPFDIDGCVDLELQLRRARVILQYLGTGITEERGDE